MAVVALGDLWGSKDMLHSFWHSEGKESKLLKNLVRVSWNFNW
jgi:hypothetical protein